MWWKENSCCLILHLQDPSAFQSQTGDSGWRRGWWLPHHLPAEGETQTVLSQWLILTAACWWRRRARTSPRPSGSWAKLWPSSFTVGTLHRWEQTWPLKVTCAADNDSASVTDVGSSRPVVPQALPWLPEPVPAASPQVKHQLMLW